MIKNNSMDKKGQIETVIGVVLIVGLIASGIYSSSELLNEHRYVGDKSVNESYDLASCMAKIDENNLVIFKNKEEAQNGFVLKSCN